MNRKGLDLQQMGRNIQALRRRRGLTQPALARLVGCSAQHISRLENGTCGMSVELFLKLCQELACRPSDILDKAE